MTSPLLPKPRGSLALWGPITLAVVAAMVLLRLVIYPNQVVPLTYVLPMLLCLLNRDVRLLWATALVFLVTILYKKAILMAPEVLSPSTRVIFASMEIINIFVAGAVIHGVIVLNTRLEAAIDTLEKSNSELEAGNEELAAREEEINQQNEELQSQAEVLEQQTEELSAQTEELQGLNEQLAARERTLSDLLEASAPGRPQEDTLARFGGTISRLLPRAGAAAILEADGPHMRVIPLFGLDAPPVVIKRDRTLADLVVSRDRAGFLADTNLRPDLDIPRLATGSDGGARALSVMAAPLRSGTNGSHVESAALEVYSRTPGEWSESDLRLGQWVAEQCGRLWVSTRLRRELDEQRDLLRLVTDNSSAALFMLDDDGRCTYANAAALTMTGYAPAELATRPLAAILHPGAPENAAWSTGELTLTRKNAEQFPASCVAIKVSRDSRSTGTVIEIRDVTDQHRAALDREQLLDSERAARAEAERAGRAKDEFVSTLSHELRTPLNAVLGWATILRKNAAQSPELSKGLEVIERNARHQAQLISDLLDMSKIIAGKIRLDVQSVDLPLVVEAAIDAVRPTADARSVRLDKVVEPVDRMVTGDPNRLQQVVWNLLTNAVKFTPKGGSVSVSLSRVASYVQISVTDSGQGIEPSLLPHLFERYRQGDSSATRQQGGLGLGLAIVKHLVELHGGTIHARSEGAGRGSTFTVLLPVRAVDPPEHIEGEPHPATPAAMILGGDTPSLSGLSILVVDDENDARELVSRVLLECGASVHPVGSADEALAALDRSNFDLLVSDIGMPGIDGYTLIKRIRAERSLDSAHLPAIALTAFARSEDRTRALLAGFQSHISKPVEPAELIATVASVRPAIRHSRGQR